MSAVARSLLVAVAAVLALAGPAPAAQPKTSLPDIEDEVMCVSCDIALSIAESPQAYRQRELIRSLVNQGLTKKQIKQRLVAEYGEDVLGKPKSSGVGLAAYLVPIAVVLALVVALVLLLPRWRRRAPSGAVAGAGGPSVTDAELQRLDDDLRRTDR